MKRRRRTVGRKEGLWRKEGLLYPLYFVQSFQAGNIGHGQYSTVQHSTVKYSVARRYSTVQYGAVVVVVAVTTGSHNSDGRIFWLCRRGWNATLSFNANSHLHIRATSALQRPPALPNCTAHTPLLSNNTLSTALTVPIWSHPALFSALVKLSPSSRTRARPLPDG